MWPVILEEIICYKQLLRLMHTWGAASPPDYLNDLNAIFRVAPLSPHMKATEMHLIALPRFPPTRLRNRDLLLLFCHSNSSGHAAIIEFSNVRATLKFHDVGRDICLSDVQRSIAAMVAFHPASATPEPHAAI